MIKHYDQIEEIEDRVIKFLKEAKKAKKVNKNMEHEDWTSIVLTLEQKLRFNYMALIFL